jgi:hypothetical protein
MKTRRTALSRIDLLVVIVIIVLVPSILMASLEAARELAKIPVCANQLRQIGRAVSLYAERYDGFMPWWGYSGINNTPPDPYGGGEESHPYVAYRQDWMANGKLIPMRLACLYKTGLITNPKIFYCPANNIPLFMYKSYIDPPPWGYLPQRYNIVGPPPNQNQWVRFGYSYYPTDPNDPKDPQTGVPLQTARRFDGLDPNIPYLTDMIRHKLEIPHNIQNTLGVNALFKDSHVVYCDDQAVFNDPVWEQWEGGQNWREFYYTVFKLIGQSCGPAAQN